MSEQLDRIERFLMSFAEQVDKRFEQVDQRLEQIDQRFEQVDQRLEQVDQRFEQIDQRFEQVDKRFERMEDQLDRIESVQHEDIVSVLQLMDQKVSDIHDLKAFMIKEQGLLKFELAKLRSKLPSSLGGMADLMGPV